MQHFIYHGRISEQGSTNAITAMSAAVQKGGEELTLHISSHGGDVNAGITLYNFLRMLPVTVHTHAIGLCESIAATVLLSGKYRTAAPASRISVHAPRFSEGPEKGQISPNVSLISEPFRAVCGWTKQEIAERFIEHGYFSMTPEEAVENRVVNGVSEPKFDRSEPISVIAVPTG